MVHSGYSSYFSGLTNMASSWSGIRSFVECCCMDKDKFKEAFATDYGITPESIVLEKCDMSLHEILSNWFCEEAPTKVTDSLLYWIALEIGEPISVYEPSDSCDVADVLSRCSGGVSRFYFVEEVCFAEFEEYMLCFMIGNNE